MSENYIDKRHRFRANLESMRYHRDLCLWDLCLEFREEADSSTGDYNFELLLLANAIDEIIEENKFDILEETRHECKHLASGSRRKALKEGLKKINEVLR